MLNRLRTRTVMAALGIGVAITLGCDGKPPTGPSQPSAPAALSVTSMLPNTGSTSGTSSVRITGTGFQSGATVTVDGAAIAATVLTQWTLSVSMPPHAGGMVNVVVTNPGGPSLQVPGGYTYVAVPVIPLAATGVFPTVGSTGGATHVTIAGTGFQSGATVTVDGVTPNYIFISTSGASISVFAPAHTAGTVDIVVTNPDGETVRLPQAYTYTSPDAFDFNGDWLGFVDDPDSPNVIRFKIQNNVLVSVSFSCGSASNPTLSPAPTVSNGEFSWVGSGGDIRGSILSANQASGTINIAPCLATWWRASRQ